jgi:serine protease Do
LQVTSYYPEEALMSALEELSAAIRAAAETTGPSVVTVNRQGCGVVVGKDRVLTNAHNLRGDDVSVRFTDEREANAAVAGADAEGDLAVLSVETGDLPPIAWATEPAQLGQVVVALSKPRGHGIRATAGTVSSLGRSFRGPRGRRILGGLEHTAPLARGSSGGPITDPAGRVIGINTHRTQEGFYLAVLADEDLRSRVDRLAAGEVPARRRLGAAIAPPQAARHLRAAAGLPEVDGLLVHRVQDSSPAERAGLRRGDVLIEASGQVLASIDDLHTALDGAGPLHFKVVRATDEIEVTVNFEE